MDRHATQNRRSNRTKNIYSGRSAIIKASRLKRSNDILKKTQPFEVEYEAHLYLSLTLVHIFQWVASAFRFSGVFVFLLRKIADFFCCRRSSFSGAVALAVAAASAFDRRSSKQQCGGGRSCNAATCVRTCVRGHFQNEASSSNTCHLPKWTMCLQFPECILFTNFIGQ